MIDRGELFAIRRRLPDMLNLCSDRWRASFVQNRYFSGGRAHLQTSAAAVISHVVLRRQVGHGMVVHVVNNGSVYVRDRYVVVESPAVPISAFVTAACIPETVIHAAIEAYVRPPIAMIQPVVTFVKGPIGRGPERSDIRGNYPDAWRPVIALIRP